MIKTREEVEELKRKWEENPVFDLEDAEGFEEYKEELILYQDFFDVSAQLALQTKKIHLLTEELREMKELKITVNAIKKLLKSVFNS